MRWSWFIWVSLYTGLNVSSGFAAPSFTEANWPVRPKLLVVISVDQLRADQLTRFTSRFLPAVLNNGKIGGYRYLMSKGAYFPFAEHETLQNITAPGHAAILTGAYPYQHGIPANEWHNSSRNEDEYCVEDSDFPQVGIPDWALKQPDAVKRNIGISPKNLIGSTLGDELKLAGFSTRVVSMALKDRAAVLLGGHQADLALWTPYGANLWVTSRRYLKGGSELPPWVRELNDSLTTRFKEPLVWEPKGKPTGLSLPDAFVVPYFFTAGEMGKSFPHRTTLGDFHAQITPFGDEMTIEAAESAVKALNLGRGEGPDLLTIGLTSNDYVGHAFGPNSLEAEEMVVAQDRMLSRLFTFLSKHVSGGLEEVLITLTADHGSPPNPDHLIREGMSAGRIDEKKLKLALEATLSEKIGKPKTDHWISMIEHLNIYLNPRELEASGVAKANAERVVKAHMTAMPEIAHVFSETDVVENHLPPEKYREQILRTYYRGRSGDVVGIVKPYYFDGSSTGGHTAGHISGYNYDARVPLMIAGRAFKAGVYAGQARIVDLAPTLAFSLGVLPPALSEGRVLVEAIGR